MVGWGGRIGHLYYPPVLKTPSRSIVGPEVEWAHLDGMPFTNQLNKVSRYRYACYPTTSELLFCQPLYVFHYTVAAGPYSVEVIGVKLTVAGNQQYNLLAVGVGTSLSSQHPAPAVK